MGVLDMEVDKVANEVADMVMDMEVDKVANEVADMVMDMEVDNDKVVDEVILRQIMLEKLTGVVDIEVEKVADMVANMKVGKGTDKVVDKTCDEVG